MSEDLAITNHIDAIKQNLARANEDSQLFKTIVDTPFQLLAVETTFLFLGIMVLLQVNPKTNMIDRVALSNTELAKNTTNVSVVPFKDIQIPTNHEANIISKAILTNTPQDTTDWKFLFNPVMNAEQARLNQASGGIAYSAVYPLTARNGGAIIYSYFQYRSEIGEPQASFMEVYTKIVDDQLAK